MKAPRFVTDLAAPSRPMPDRYAQLAVLEPALAELWGDADYYARYWARHPIERLRGRAASWESIKGRLVRLVGLGRADDDDILGSFQAFDCAYLALKNVMGV